MGLVVDLENGAPLQQGDILKCGVVYQTGPDGESPELVEPWFEYVLVISRNCNACRKGTVSVVGIRLNEPAIFAALNDRNLVETIRMLAALRDGDGSPDSFYLGCLPHQKAQRAFAKLDAIYSLRLPIDEPARRDWVDARRVGTLSAEHRRHLHISLFNSISREGFDDHKWWPDGDLRLVFAAGLREETALRVTLAAVIPEIERLPSGPRRDKEVAKKQDLHRKLDEVRASLEPYRTEWELRYPGTDPLT